MGAAPLGWLHEFTRPDSSARGLGPRLDLGIAGRWIFLFWCRQDIHPLPETRSCYVRSIDVALRSIPSP